MGPNLTHKLMNNFQLNVASYVQSCVLCLAFGGIGEFQRTARNLETQTPA